MTFYGSFARSTGSAVKLSTLTVTEASGGSLPGAAGTITGPNTVCATSTQTYSVGTISGATSYVWSVPTGASIVSGQGTTSISVSFSASAVSGNVSVYGTNSVGNGPSSSLGITVNPVPAQPSAVTGDNTACQGSTHSYSVTFVAGTTYNWVVPGGSTINSGQGTNTISVTFGANSGNVEAVPSNSCGNGPGSALNITINPTPYQPSAIVGASGPCQGSSQTYSVQNVNGLTYTWTVPTGCTITSGQGSNSISVNVGSTSGQIEVVPSNACGNGPAQSKMIEPSVAPAQPSAIVGSGDPCEGSSRTYSVTNIAGATFNWSVPSGSTITAGQGSNSITVTIGSTNGDVSVTASNACGTSPASVKSLTVSPLPGTTAAATGPLQVNVANNPTSNYTTTGAINATSYTWELSPANAGTLSANGTSVTITWSNTFTGTALLRVKGANSCGDGTWSSNIEIQVTNTTGIPENGAYGIKLYPVPAGKNVTIETTSPFTTLQFRLVDLNGKTLMSQQITGNGKTQLVLDLPSGKYIAMVENAEYHHAQTLIVK